MRATTVFARRVYANLVGKAACVRVAQAVRRQPFRCAIADYSWRADAGGFVAIHGIRGSAGCGGC